MTMNHLPHDHQLPLAYMLIGVPASGKSTWAKNHLGAKSPMRRDNLVYLSTDHYIERFAKRMGNKTYSEVYETIMPRATRLMNRALRLAVHRKRDLVWDQTSLTAKTRKHKLHSLRSYFKVAVVFQIPDSEELARRLASRPGKIIPDTVMQWMVNSYEPPTIEEGFHEIWYV